MGTISIWVGDNVEKVIKDFAKKEDKSVGQYVKDYLNSRFAFTAKMDEDDLAKVDDLYAWFFYHGDASTLEEAYVKTMFLNENWIPVTNIIRKHDELMTITHSLGLLCMNIALIEKLPESILAVKDDLIDDYKHIFWLPERSDRARILWRAVIDKIDILREKNNKNWREYYFAFGLLSVLSTSDATPVGVYHMNKFSDHTENWDKLAKKTRNLTHNKNYSKRVICCDCRQVNNDMNECGSCGGRSFYTDYQFK